MPDLLLNMVLFAELIGVAETTEDVAEVVGDPVDVLEVAVSVPVAEAVADVEPSPSPVVEEAGAEFVVVSAVVPESSCRRTGRTRPARATFRHRSRARRAHSLWETAMARIFERVKSGGLRETF